MNERIFDLLSDSEESFAQAVASVKDYAIFALDARGYVCSWNEGARRIKGYNRNEIIGKHFSIFYTAEDKLRDHPAFELEEAKKAGSYEEQGWRVRKDGSVFWANVTITPMLKESGGFIKVTRDLTERKLYQSELEEARDQALAANRLKSQFVANVSHELRTPLTSIVGLSELLVRDPDVSEGVHKISETIFESSKQLVLMLNDLLDFAKLEAGKMTVEKIPFSVRKTVQEAAELVRRKCEGKGLRLSVDLCESLPDLLVGDPNKVRQILTNLLDNAIKFTDAGAIELTAEAKGDHVVLTVTDTGIGIAAEKLESLFHPFSQVHDSSAKYGGTGLGLAIAEQYVHLMNGQIDVVSQEGLGTTFWFALPLASSEQESHE